ncbi:type III pantothenate kinase [Flavobacterium sp. Sd200]|uniref:type III pantothenate kinase n=1 Tax=Flavobacterium sp. Sd200 TaxID=2692211 RepID=UPI001368B9E1|nr:type III pantothenate kinase [Flavobacterium sp. Sd200]MXN92214.1 type III pantothenate kinase [Flavobacterium sp. Sd200]
MLLAVDVGNTKIKAAVFEDTALVEKFVFNPEEGVFGVEKILKKIPDATQSIMSVVGKEDNELLLWLQQNTKLTAVNHDLVFPFINDYATPATLGIDRMVLAAGAVLKYPARNRLVIDAGTCVTYDFVTNGNHYLGGAISPGLQLRYNAMHNFTAKLPLLYPEMPQNYIGNSTKSAMHSGVVNGLLHEVEGFTQQYNQQYQDVMVILTGGDADFLAKRLKSTIFANSNFLLESLNLLYLYTNQK